MPAEAAQKQDVKVLPSATMPECVGEFIGTYLLILTVGCNVLGGNPVMAVLSIASVLMVSIYALAGISGANLNPAVSFALFLAGEFSASKFFAYAATQLVAGAAAGASYIALHGNSVNLAPNADYHWTSAIAVEILYTFMLVFTVLRTAVSKGQSGNHPEVFGLAIGFTVVAGGYGGGAISMGCFNPAVAFGVDVSSANLGFHWCIWYTIAELVGAALAVSVHKFVDGKTETSHKFVAEFVGTFFLVLTVGLNVLTLSPAGALSIAASLMCMIYCFADVSGSHFNPAVTFAIWCSGKIESAELAPYMCAQLLGGLVAGLTYSGLTGVAFPLAPGTGYSWADAAFAEIVYTFVLCFTVLNAAVFNDNHKNIFALAIGFCVVVGGFAIGKISGGSLNPAVSFGIDTSYAMKGGSWMNCLAYTGFELIGGGLAAGATKIVRPTKA